MEIDPSAHPIAYLSVRNMTSNLHYLGFCFNFQPDLKPPLCCHAYALTLTGTQPSLLHCTLFTVCHYFHVSSILHSITTIYSCLID